MLRQVFYRIAWAFGNAAVKRGEAVRAWAWNRLISGWPPEIARVIIKDLDHGRVIR